MCAVVDTALADMVLNGSGLTIGIRAMLNTSVAMQNSDWGSTAVRDGATAAGGATLRCACGLPERSNTSRRHRRRRRRRRCSTQPSRQQLSLGQPPPLTADGAFP